MRCVVDGDAESSVDTGSDVVASLARDPAPWPTSFASVVVSDAWASSKAVEASFEALARSTDMARRAGARARVREPPQTCARDMALDGDAFVASEDDMRAERAAFLKIIRAVYAYPDDVARDVARWRASLDSAHIPAHHRPLLANAVRELDRAEACAEANTAFTRAAIDNFVHNPYAPEHLRVPEEEVERWAREAETFRAAKDDVDKVRYVLKNAYRDWSSDGAVERDEVYRLIFDALRAKFNVNVDVGSPDGEAPRVLAPGCGLGRLVFELARQGYDVQGNEFSYFMLFFSSFMLNATRDVGEFGIHPFMHARSNHRRMEDAWRETRVPDVVPGDVTFPPGASMSMAAGDFTAVYGTTAERGQWDAVVTAYFIDTAHNVCEYLECVANCLRTGGVWVNFGPLLYHWEEYHDELSVELSLDDVIAAAESFGLRVEKCEFHDAMYTSDERSFHKTTYTCAFIVAVKE